MCPEATKNEKKDRSYAIFAQGYDSRGGRQRGDQGGQAGVTSIIREKPTLRPSFWLLTLYGYGFSTQQRTFLLC